MRKSNLELLRIVSMCGIVVMHYFGMGGAVQSSIFPTFSWFVTHFLNSFCIPLVNCFVLITGYFLINKTVLSLRKPAELLIITAFYGAISYLVAVSIERGQISPGDALRAILPFLIVKRWFVETYILLLLFAPFLSLLLRCLKQAHYRLLLGIQLAVFCLWYSLGFSAPVLDDGYGLTNFITLYMLGGYIRLHGASLRRISVCSLAAVYVLCALATFILSYFINPFGYAFVTNILGSVAAFALFLNWEMGVRPAVNRISAAAFDVYFIHSDFNTSYLLFSCVLGARFVTDTPWMLPHLLLVIPAVWVLGFLCFHGRKWLFARFVDPILDRWNLINRKIDLSDILL